MAVTASYPNGIVPWTNRVDKVNTVFAVDPNTLAAEVIAIESTLGTNPQNEAASPAGSLVKYATVSARIHDVQLGNQLPVASLQNPGFIVNNNSSDAQNSYSVLYDPFNHYNGFDLTVKSAGWYVVTAHQTFAWAASGTHSMQVMLGGTLIGEEHWNWSFAQNSAGNYWWHRPKLFTAVWQGIIQAKQRISVISHNSSNLQQVNVSNATLKISYVRAVPTTARG